MPVLGSGNPEDAASKPGSSPDPAGSSSAFILRIRVPQRSAPVALTLPQGNQTSVKTVKQMLMEELRREPGPTSSTKPAAESYPIWCKLVGRGRELQEDCALQQYNIGSGEVVHGIVQYGRQETAEPGPPTTAVGPSGSGLSSRTRRGENTTQADQSTVRRSSSASELASSGFDQLLAAGINRDEIRSLRDELMQTFGNLPEAERRQREEALLAPVQLAARARRSAALQSAGPAISSSASNDPLAGLTPEERAEIESRAVRLAAPPGSGPSSSTGDTIALEMPQPPPEPLTRQQADAAERLKMLKELFCIVIGLFLGPLGIVFLVHEAISLKHKIAFGIGIGTHILFALYGIATYDLEYVR
jgi:hypothetical protein